MDDNTSEVVTPLVVPLIPPGISECATKARVFSADSEVLVLAKPMALEFYEIYSDKLVLVDIYAVPEPPIGSCTVAGVAGVNFEGKPLGKQDVIYLLSNGSLRVVRWRSSTNLFYTFFEDGVRTNETELTPLQLENPSADEVPDIEMQYFLAVSPLGKDIAVVREDGIVWRYLFRSPLSARRYERQTHPAVMSGLLSHIFESVTVYETSAAQVLDAAFVPSAMGALLALVHRTTPTSATVSVCTPVQSKWRQSLALEAISKHKGTSKIAYAAPHDSGFLEFTASSIYYHRADDAHADIGEDWMDVDDAPTTYTESIKGELPKTERVECCAMINSYQYLISCQSGNFYVVRFKIPQPAQAGRANQGTAPNTQATAIEVIPLKSHTGLVPTSLVYLGASFIFASSFSHSSSLFHINTELGRLDIIQQTTNLGPIIDMVIPRPQQDGTPLPFSAPQLVVASGGIGGSLKMISSHVEPRTRITVENLDGIQKAWMVSTGNVPNRQGSGKHAGKVVIASFGRHTRVFEVGDNHHFRQLSSWGSLDLNDGTLCFGQLESGSFVQVQPSKVRVLGFSSPGFVWKPDIDIPQISFAQVSKQYISLIRADELVVLDDKLHRVPCRDALPYNNTSALAVTGDWVATSSWGQDEVSIFHIGSTVSLAGTIRDEQLRAVRSMVISTAGSSPISSLIEEPLTIVFGLAEGGVIVHNFSSHERAPLAAIQVGTLPVELYAHGEWLFVISNYVGTIHGPANTWDSCRFHTLGVATPRWVAVGEDEDSFLVCQNNSLEVLDLESSPGNNINEMVFGRNSLVTHLVDVSSTSIGPLPGKKQTRSRPGSAKSENTSEAARDPVVVAVVLQKFDTTAAKAQTMIQVVGLPSKRVYTSVVIKDRILNSCCLIEVNDNGSLKHFLVCGGEKYVYPDLWSDQIKDKATFADSVGAQGRKEQLQSWLEVWEVGKKGLKLVNDSPSRFPTAIRSLTVARDEEEQIFVSTGTSVCRYAVRTDGSLEPVDYGIAEDPAWSAGTILQTLGALLVVGDMSNAVTFVNVVDKRLLPRVDYGAPNTAITALATLYTGGETIFMLAGDDLGTLSVIEPQFSLLDKPDTVQNRRGSEFRSDLGVRKRIKSRQICRLSGGPINCIRQAPLFEWNRSFSVPNSEFHAGALVATAYGGIYVVGVARVPDAPDAVQQLYVKAHQPGMDWSIPRLSRAYMDIQVGIIIDRHNLSADATANDILKDEHSDEFIVVPHRGVSDEVTDPALRKAADLLRRLCISMS